MIRSAAVSLIKEGLAFRTDTMRDASIILRLQQAQRLMEQGKILPRFLLQEDASLAVAAGTAEVSLPTGFLREKKGEELHYNDATTGEPVFLENLGYDVAKQRFFNVDPGKPIAYVLRTSSLIVYPERDVAYTLTWSYYKAADLLTTDIENAWLANAPDLLIGKAGMLIARALRDAEAAALFMEIYTEAGGDVEADDILRDEETRPVVMGSRL